MSFGTILVPIEQHDLMSSTLETALCLAWKFDSYIEGFALRVANPAAYAMADATAVIIPIIPNAFGERAVLKLMFGTLIRAAERWRSVKVTEFERRQLAAVRKELDQEYETQVGLKKHPSKDAAHVKISSSPRT